MRKAKGSGFKMRSGNKTEFKKMGSSPAKTDATLVAAAQDLGRSNIPKDNKEIVEKQYEGLIEYNKAKTQMTADIVGGVAKGAEAYSKGEGAIQNVKGKIAEYKEYKKGLGNIQDATGMDKKEAKQAMADQGYKFRITDPAVDVTPEKEKEFKQKYQSKGLFEGISDDTDTDVKKKKKKRKTKQQKKDEQSIIELASDARKAKWKAEDDAFIKNLLYGEDEETDE